MDDWTCVEAKDRHDRGGVYEYPESMVSGGLQWFFHDACDGGVGAEFRRGKGNHDQAQKEQ